MIVFTYYMHGRQQGEQALAPLPLENKKHFIPMWRPVLFSSHKGTFPPGGGLFFTLQGLISSCGGLTSSLWGGGGGVLLYLGKMFGAMHFIYYINRSIASKVDSTYLGY